VKKRLVSKRFIKSQINSAVSTLVDFSVTILMKEFIGIWYLLSSASGTFLGGCCNFTLGRLWVFKVIPENRIKMMIRYICFWAINFLLNVGSVYLLTEYLHINYVISKVMAALMFGVFVNYYLQKRVVYNVYLA